MQFMHFCHWHRIEFLFCKQIFPWVVCCCEGTCTNCTWLGALCFLVANWRVLQFTLRSNRRIFFLQTGVVHGYNYIYTRIIFIILVYQCTKEDLDWHDILYIFQFYRISHGVFGDTITKKNISCRRLERYRFMSQDHSRITICEVILARINIQFQWESLGRAKTMPTACMSSHDSPSIRSIWLCFLCILFS